MTDYITIPPPKEIPYGYCHCGCGQKTRIAKQTHYIKDGTCIIAGKPNLYFVSHSGVPIDRKFWQYIDVRVPMECWNWMRYKLPSGYGMVSMNGKVEYTHRVSYIICIGEIPKGLSVLHRCDNPSCCNPNHLFLGTQTENLDDMTKKGRRRYRAHRGSENGSAKLNESLVIEIRSKYKNGARISKLAKEYRVNNSTIWCITTNRHWKNVL